MEGDQSIPRNVYGSVKAYANFDAHWNTLNIEMAIKAKGVDEVTIINILTNHNDEWNQDIALVYQKEPKRNLHQQ